MAPPPYSFSVALCQTVRHAFPAEISKATTMFSFNDSNESRKRTEDSFESTVPEERTSSLSFVAKSVSSATNRLGEFG